MKTLYLKVLNMTRTRMLFTFIFYLILSVYSLKFSADCFFKIVIVNTAMAYHVGQWMCPAVLKNRT